MRTAPSIVVETDPSATPLLTRETRAALDGALNVLRDVARRHSIPDSTVTIERDTGYDEPIDQLVLTHRVQLPAGAALDYWEALADAVVAWTATLPAPLRALAEERIAVSVEWPTHVERA